MNAPASIARRAAAHAAARSHWPIGAAIAVAGLILLLLVVVISGGVIGVSLNDSTNSASSTPSQAALSDIPADYLELYQQAGAQAGIDWAILAGIGKVETNHGRSRLPGVQSGVNSYGCCAGPMQFNITNGPPSTWDTYARDSDGDGQISPYEPADAIPAAARLLTANGAPGDNRRAIFSYNHAGWYVDEVLAAAARYREAQALAPATQASASEVLANPRIQLTPLQRQDLLSGLIDPRVIRSLAAIGQTHTVLVSALKSDHAPGTNHEAGRAVDIAAIDGDICTGTQTGACGRLMIQLAQVRGADRSTELIYCFDADPLDPNVFARADHCDHIHLGYDANSG